MPGHPVPINTEGKACMHMQRDNEGIKLPKLLGLAVAGATLLAGMVVLPATQASADTNYGYTAEDDFKPGALLPNEQPTLTVTKFLSLSDGGNPTGSSADLDKLKTNNHELVPAQDILFNVQEVKAASGKSLADIKPDDASSYQTVGDPYAGVTDGQGVINQWYKAETTGENIGKIAGAKANGQPSETSTKVDLPKAKDGVGHYFILTENKDKSWAFNENNDHKLDKTKYGAAAASFFGLPYAAQSLDNTTPKVTGYIYHLHLYPKNVNTNAFSKTVQNVYDSSTGAAKTQRTAVAGDKIDYKLSQKINAQPVTGQLDVSQLAGDYADIKISDRMSTALKMDEGTIKAIVYYKDNSGAQQQKELSRSGDTIDYKMDNLKNPDRLTGNTGKMFSTTDNYSNYYNFTFFGSQQVINLLKTSAKSDIHVDVTYSATVTPDGDSTGTNGVANDASADFRGNTGATIVDHTNVINAVFVFGAIKSANHNYDALPKTEFRLVQDETHQDSYLATDGNFYADEATAEASNAKLYKATANDQGLVAFAGLPIFGSAARAGDSAGKTVKQVQWSLKETSTPSGFRSPSTPFSTITYSNVAGQTEEQLAQTYGPNAAIEPAYASLKFGPFEVTPAQYVAKKSQPLKYNNVAIQKYLAHSAEGDADAPLSLPLTGGRGIVLLLVVGALLMGGALYARSRRNNAARA